MIKWKQRLYAFLLRRVLGPFLDSTSQQKLHESIEVSFQEGTFTLNNVGLCTSYLNNKLEIGAVRIKKARIESISIQLSLVEGENSDSHENNGMSKAPSSSLAWRAFNLGSKVSLVAHVDIDGIELQAEPFPKDCARNSSAATPSTHSKSKTTTTTSPLHHHESEKMAKTESETPSTTKSIMSSYIESALASLQLSLNLSNFSVRLRQPTSDETTTWVELRLPSLAYQDLDSRVSPHAAATANSQRNIPKTASNYRTILEKSVLFQGITIVAGETRTLTASANDEGTSVESSLLVSTIALAEGTGNITLRAVEYQSGSNSTMKTTNGICSQTNNNIGGRVQVQHDIEVRLNQQVKISVDERSLVQLQSVLEGFRTVTATNDLSTNTPESIKQDNSDSDVSESRQSDNNSGLDETELYTLDGIMKQYQEARKLAERNEMRGGILIPSNAYEEGSHVGDGDARTFDIFFDANDMSFSHYASMMKESVVASQANGSSPDFVHTKLRLHLLGGGLKVSFRNRNNATESILGPEEYLLLTFNDIDVTSKVSCKKTDFTLNVGRFEIDDAQMPYRDIDSKYCRRVEIGNMMSFAESAPEDDLNGGDVLVQPACISMQACIESEPRDGSKSFEFEMNLKPIDLVYRHRTISHLGALLKTLLNNRQQTQKENENVASQNDNKLQIKSGVCTIASLTLTFPVLEERDFSTLYHRCGHYADASSINGSAVGIVFDQLSFEHKPQTDTNEGDSKPTSVVTTSLGCHNIICYASSPESIGTSLGRLIHRLDFLAAAGRFEVDPYIPIAMEYRQNVPGRPGEVNVGRDTFPAVPAFSSFKARQEDEDEDEEIDRILSEKLKEVSVDSRKALRAKDPQGTMLQEAESCDAVIMLHIPEMVADLSRDELVALLEMIHCILPKRACATRTDTPPSVPSSRSIAVSLACDTLSLSIHKRETIRERPRWNSFLLRFDRCRAHTIPGGTPTHFVRFLSHEMTMFEIQNLVDFCQPIRAPSTPQDRVRTMKGRTSRKEGGTTVPLLYRSRLMPAISHGSPSFLVDIIEPVDMCERSIFLSIYNITYRYNPDSQWLERLQGFFKDLNPQAGTSSTAEQTFRDDKASESESGTYLTRFFLSIADCNFDYMSLPQFNTSSRSILRLGDLRLSSNILTPAGAVQAYSLSMGDFSWYLCNTRFPYNYENALLHGSLLILPPEDLSVGLHRSNDVHAASLSEIVFREMGFKTILTLESLDAIIAQRNQQQEARKIDMNTLEDPKVTVSLTLGELSLYACKDSFRCFLSTIGELQTKLTALSNEALEELRSRSLSASSLTETDQQKCFFDAQSEYRDVQAQNRKQYVNNAVQTVPVDKRGDFLLDGYDWTTIDHEPGITGEIPPGEEQFARWYNSPDASTNNGALEDSILSTAHESAEHQARTPCSFRVISQHFPLQVVSDPLGGGDMDATRHAGTEAVFVGTRILLHDMKFKCRLFDGYDWPEYQTQRKRNQQGLFVIDEAGFVDADNPETKKPDSGSGHQRKAELLGGLLAGAPDKTATFGDLPLPEERIKSFLTQNELRRLSRRTNSYVQFFADGVSLRLDSYCDSSKHRLKSCVALALRDFFLAETISDSTPIKMIGEWFNEVEHPRDSNDGLLMLKMVTWNPVSLVTPDNKIASEESEVALTLAPMRCVINQRAIKFTKAFFGSGSGGDEDASTSANDWAAELHLIPPPFLRKFLVQPVKLKIDYFPQKIDTLALKNGSVVELINLSPLDAMVLTLHSVEIENVVGVGEAMGGLVSHWLGDICATQMYKFLTNARPFEPLSNIGGGVVDLFVLPWDAYKNGERVSRALRSSVSSLVGTVAHETLTTSSRMTAFLAGEMARATSCSYTPTSASNSSLPSRPLGTPRRIGDTAGHALESLARGVQTANYKVIIVPYREYRRIGARGAVKSIVKGIPVAVAAPVSGASEALSYALLGARNQIRPDIRKEEEVSRRGLHYGGL